MTTMATGRSALEALTPSGDPEQDIEALREAADEDISAVSDSLSDFQDRVAAIESACGELGELGQHLSRCVDELEDRISATRGRVREIEQRLAMLDGKASSAYG